MSGLGTFEQVVIAVQVVKIAVKEYVASLTYFSENIPLSLPVCHTAVLVILRRQWIVVEQCYVCL